MERRQFAAAFDLVHHVGRHADAAVEEFAAVGHAVADGIDAVERVDDAFFRAYQGVEHELDAGRVVGDHVADAFYETLLHQGIVFGAPHIEQLIFQRGASAVEDKDNHSFGVLDLQLILQI